MAGYAAPTDEAKRLRRKLAFTDYVITELRERAVRYAQILELSKQNIVYLLSTDETPDNVRAALSLGVLKVLAKSGRDGKSLIERAVDEDAKEQDPRMIAQRLIAATTPAPSAPLPQDPPIIDAEVTEA